MQPHIKFESPTSKNIGNVHWTGSKQDGQTDGRTEEWAVWLLYASQSSFEGIENSFVKKSWALDCRKPSVYKQYVDE